MAFDEVWLKSRVEDIVAPDLPICDPHHHLWEYPTSRYLLDEFLTDLAQGHRVEKTVYVECLMNYRSEGPSAMRPVGETEYVEQVTRHCDRPAVAAGIVGFADLCLGEQVRPVLEAHKAASSRFRGIRHASAWHEHEKIHNAHTKPPPKLLSDRKFRQGFAELSKLALTFDAWLYHTQIDELADLAGHFPSTPIVLNHLGGPIGIGPYQGKRDEVFAKWRRSIARLAQHPNVFMKLGGVTMTLSGFGWHKLETPPASSDLAEAMMPYFDVCMEHFGAERCMFESNFPVDRISCSYNVLWNAFKHVSADCSEGERRALLYDTAVKFYCL